MTDGTEEDAPGEGEDEEELDPDVRRCRFNIPLANLDVLAVQLPRSHFPCVFQCFVQLLSSDGSQLRELEG